MPEIDVVIFEKNFSGSDNNATGSHPLVGDIGNNAGESSPHAESRVGRQKTFHRYGGTEFWLILTGDTACSLYRRLRVVVNELIRQDRPPRSLFTFMVGYESTPIAGVENASYNVCSLTCIDSDCKVILRISLEPAGTGKNFGNINPQIDTSFTKKCLMECLDSHTGCGSKNQFPTPRSTTFTYVIDVKENCLVKSDFQCTKYVALSYVWGSAAENAPFESSACRRENLTSMQTSGFLISIQGGLPATIQDSIEFCRIMDQRCLWVDRHCIVQDDRESKYSQLQVMGAIYSHAVFTIVAADGTATTGLQGLGAGIDWQLRKGMNEKFTLVPNYESQISGDLPHYLRRALRDCRWKNRAWTFQEELFSQRRFYFLKEMVLFNCQRIDKVEGEDSPLLGGGASDDTIDNFQLPNWPDLSYLNYTLTSFAKRSCTYPCDSLAAFSGVFGALSSIFPGGFLFGLPELYFSIALLWEANIEPLVDRVSTSIEQGKQTAELPWWSWARFQGDINFYCWEFGFKGLVGHEKSWNVDVAPIVDWYKICRQTGKKQLVNDKYRVFEHAEEEAIPFGWTKWGEGGEDEEIEEEEAQGVKEARDAEEAEEADPKPASQGWHHPLARPQKSPDFVITFRFPVPLTEEQCNISGSITTADQWAPQIWTKAKRAHVLMNEMMELHLMPRLGLANTETPIGHMKPDQILDLSAGPRIVEVIAISTSTFSRSSRVREVRAFVDDEKLALLDTELLDNEYRIHRCYNVMMIEWIGGRAERRGIGRIRQSVWEDSKLITLEEIEVTLV